MTAKGTSGRRDSGHGSIFLNEKKIRDIRKESGTLGDNYNNNNNNNYIIIYNKHCLSEKKFDRRVTKM